jgi:hypothetical protein
VLVGDVTEEPLVDLRLEAAELAGEATLVQPARFGRPMAGMAQMGRCHLRLLGSLSQQRFIFFVSYEWVHLARVLHYT